MSTWTRSFLIDEQPVLDDTWAVTGELIIEWERDRHYGADADGNGGVDRTGESCREWRLVSAAPLDEYGNLGHVVIGAAIPDEVVAAAQEWADAHQPDDDSNEADDEREEN